MQNGVTSERVQSGSSRAIDHQHHYALSLFQDDVERRAVKSCIRGQTAMKDAASAKHEGCCLKIEQ